MPSKIWAVLAIIIVSGGLLKWAHYEVDTGGYNRHKAETLKAVNDAVVKAREEEQTKQGEVNDASQKQFDEVTGINAQLNRELGRLRSRPNRTKLSDSAKLRCKGVTGAELSSEDSGFLTRLAAEADRLRSGLKACYTYADSVTKKSPSN